MLKQRQSISKNQNDCLTSYLRARNISAGLGLTSSFRWSIAMFWQVLWTLCFKLVLCDHHSDVVHSHFSGLGWATIHILQSWSVIVKSRQINTRLIIYSYWGYCKHSNNLLILKVKIKKKSTYLVFLENKNTFFWFFVII